MIKTVISAQEQKIKTMWRNVQYFDSCRTKEYFNAIELEEQILAGANLQSKGINHLNGIINGENVTSDMMRVDSSNVEFYARFTRIYRIDGDTFAKRMKVRNY